MFELRFNELESILFTEKDSSVALTTVNVSLVDLLSTSIFFKRERNFSDIVFKKLLSFKLKFVNAGKLLSCFSI